MVTGGKIQRKSRTKLLDEIKELEFLRKEYNMFIKIGYQEYSLYAIAAPILLYIHSIKPINWKAFWIVVGITYFLKIVLNGIAMYGFMKQEKYNDEIKEKFHYLLEKDKRIDLS